MILLGDDDLDELRLALEESFSAVAESLEMSEFAIHFLSVKCSAKASFTNLLSDSLTMAMRLERLLLYPSIVGPMSSFSRALHFGPSFSTVRPLLAKIREA